MIVQLTIAFLSPTFKSSHYLAVLVFEVILFVLMHQDQDTRSS